MRYRVIFFAGLAIGFVLGARAGRERYEQLRAAARKAADSPAVQQAAGALQAQLTNAARSAGGKLVSSAGAARAKVGGALHDRMPGTRARDANGQAGSTRRERYAPAPGNQPEG